LIFDIKVGIEADESKKLIKRDAVRAISFRDNKILMLSSERGDYKLPGGGIEHGETGIQALHREIKEETGYSNSDVLMKIGCYLERKIDKYNSECIFEMNSDYYLCVINGEADSLALTSSEEALGMKPIWIDIDDVIDANDEFFRKNQTSDLWTSRELKVLKILRDEYKMINAIYHNESQRV